jgi:hypothetical protein
LNLQKFVDSIPKSLLGEYFTQKVSHDDSLQLKTFDFKAISAFIDSNRDKEVIDSILEDFTHINDICEKVYNILIQATLKYNIMTSGEETREELAMDLILHNKEAFDYAYDRYCLFNSSCKMSQHHIESEDYVLTHENLERFKSEIRRYFKQLAKGEECIIRHYDEDGQTVLIVIHGSYKRSMAVWSGKKIETIFFRPANEDILVYNDSNSTLSVKTRFPKDRNQYIKTFTSTIIEDATQANREDRDATYTLKPLQDGSLSFAGNEEIISITLREVKLSCGGVTSPEITIKSNDVMETLRDNKFGITLQDGEIVRAKFRFRLRVNKKERNVSFVIQPPNVTDLNKKKYADIISAYLKGNGIKLI